MTVKAPVRDIKEVLEEMPTEIRKIVSRVIELEHANIHHKKPHGIKDEIAKIVKEVIKS